MGYSVSDNKKAPQENEMLLEVTLWLDSPNWTWTSDTLINSQVLYRLSYGGIKQHEVRDEPNLCRSVGEYLSSRAVSSQVLSARQSLTSVFGMGTGGPSA